MADPTDPTQPPRQGPAHADTMRQRGAKVSAVDSSLIARVAGGASDILRWLGLGAAAQRQLDSQGPSAGLPQMEEPAAPPPEGGRPTGGGPSTTPGQPQTITGSGVWFGPGSPLTPIAPKREVAGRAFDYATNVNLVTRPRAYESISFDQLRGLASPGGYDPLRLAIETRKDQIAKLTWSILPKKPAGQSFRPKADDRCRTIEEFFRRPDGIHSWDQWIRMVAEEQLVIDAVSLYKRYDNSGKPYALEVVDGSTILPRIDGTGRRPLPPEPAYSQILKGVAATNYSASELYYCPRNPRVQSMYGLSPVEQVLMTVQTGVHRALSQYKYFTEGNMPEALIGVPETWSVDQINQFQRYWDDLNSDIGRRRRARFVPGQFAYQPTRADGALTDAFDEWLVRIICYAFSLPTLPFVKQQNRATAESAADAALEEGLAPFMVWIKNIIDWAIKDFHGAEDYELVWDDVRKLDPSEQAQQDVVDVQNGFKSIDDVRAARGEDPYGLPAIRWGVGPLGFMSVTAIKKAIDEGLDVVQPPMQPGMGPEGFAPGADPLAGASPELLAQLGAGPPQGGQRPPPDEEGEDEGADAPPQMQGQGAGAAMTGMPGSPAQRLSFVAPTTRDFRAVRGAKPDPMVSRTIRNFSRRRRA